MYQMAMTQLQAWKMKERRKPLIIRGARQVGKTWLMREFGASEYASMVYINFDNNERMKALFEGGLEVDFVIDTGSAVSFLLRLEAGGIGLCSEHLAGTANTPLAL